MENKHSHRKDEHVSLAQKFYTSKNSFEDIRFIHQGLSDLAIDQIDISTNIGSIKLAAPFYIEAMSGGSQQTAKINQRLASIAKRTGLAMAVGSQSVALKIPELNDTFRIVREVNPEGIVIANIGADHTPDDAKRAIEMINADILEVHINSVQELIMPEGNREFDFLNNITAIIHNIKIPVIVKEVGFGMSKETITKLKSVGVKYINVSGTGGTNFAKIENFRRHNKDLDFLADWGLTTVESLYVAKPFEDLTIIASGGVKSPLDVAKCLALGSSAVGIAGYFLNQLFNHSDDEIVDLINNWIYGLKSIMLLTNSKNISELQNANLILSEKLLSYLAQTNKQPIN